MRKLFRPLDEVLTGAIVLAMCFAFMVTPAFLAEIPNTSVFSQTDANNNTGTVPTWAEGQAPSQVNDSARALQGAITREWNWRNPTITSAGNDTITLTYSVAPAAYYNGQRFCFEAGGTTTGASTINVNSVGAIAVRRYTAAGTLGATVAGTITAGDRPCVTYRTTGPFFVLESGVPGYAAGGTDVALADGGTGASLVDPNADRFFFWDDSEGSTAFLTPGDGLTISTTTVTVDDATESVDGVCELATTAEVEAGTDTTRCTTAAGVLAAVSGKHTIWIPAAAMTARTTNGCAAGSTETGTNDIMVVTKDCDQTTSEGVQFTVAMPKNWNEGTVTFQPFWTAAAGSAAQTMIWSMRGVAISNDEVLDSAFGTAQTSSDALIATTDLHVGPESSAITIAGTPAEADWIVFEVSRDISDTLAADAKLIGVKVIYTINAFTDD